MRSTLRIVAFAAGAVLMTVLLLAQDGAPAKSPATKPAATAPGPTAAKSTPPAPVITDAHRADFFQRQLELIQAQQAVQQAQSAFQAVVAELTADCGEKFIPQIGPDKKPVCVAKQDPAKPSTPEKKESK